MKHNAIRNTQAVLYGILCLAMLAGAPSASADPVIIDHTCTDVSIIPDEWITQARQLTFHYAHTSHGSQIVTGIGNLYAIDTRFAFAINESEQEGLPPQLDPPVLLIYDGNPPETYIEPDDYWETAEGRDRTRAVIGTGHYDFSMWSWCGQLSWYTEDQVDTYLQAMNDFEAEFPGVRFIYMTGHLDGSGSEGDLNLRNEQIRTYCRNNNKVLFDFADIESYDPDGQPYLNYYADDNCDYSGGNWAISWCNANPDSDMCGSCDCAHSQCLNCNLKGRAFWWMMARLSGWDGSPEDDGGQANDNANDNGSADDNSNDNLDNDNSDENDNGNQSDDSSGGTVPVSQLCGVQGASMILLPLALVLWLIVRKR